MPCSACGGGSRHSQKKSYSLKGNIVKQRTMTMQQYQQYLRYLQKHQVAKARFQLRF